MVVGATGTGDIVAAMRWAAATRTPVAVQATGHGANSPVDSGLLINTARLTDVHVDETTRTATIAAGAKWRNVLEAAAPHGLAALTGTSTDAGAVGYTVGGGLPVLGRAYTATPPTWSAPSRSSQRTASSARRARRRNRNCSGRCAAARATWAW